MEALELGTLNIVAGSVAALVAAIAVGRMFYIAFTAPTNIHRHRPGLCDEEPIGTVTLSSTREVPYQFGRKPELA